MRSKLITRNSLIGIHLTEKEWLEDSQIQILHTSLILRHFIQGLVSVMWTGSRVKTIRSGGSFGFRFFWFLDCLKREQAAIFCSFPFVFYCRYIFNFWAKKPLPPLLPVVWYSCFSSRKCLWTLSDPTKGNLIMSWWLYQQGLFYCSRMNVGNLFEQWQKPWLFRDV